MNIGGTEKIMTSRKVLCEGAAKGSKLAELFSLGADELKLNTVADKIFIDRDGKTFAVMVNYLRNDCMVQPRFESEYDESLFKAEL